MSLRAAQQAIAGDWWAAYERYGGSGAADVWVGSCGSTTPPSSSTTTATPVAAAPAGATARCVDGTYSYSAHRRGNCSHHGRVATWINPPPA